jgi:hypothetical protein
MEPAIRRFLAALQTLDWDGTMDEFTAQMTSDPVGLVERLAMARRLAHLEEDVARDWVAKALGFQSFADVPRAFTEFQEATARYRKTLL